VSEIVVKVADMAVTRDGAIVTLGLGSCVAIVLHEAEAGVGGLAHILLPSKTLARDRSNQAKFPETAVPLLLAKMAELGAARERVRARLVGGAAMFANLASSGVAQMGERNVLAAKEALKVARVPLVGEDTGLDYGRSVWFHLPEGRLEIRSVQRGTREL
jgi:chemotaxis protein CheD